MVVQVKERIVKAMWEHPVGIAAAAGFAAYAAVRLWQALDVRKLDKLVHDLGLDFGGAMRDALQDSGIPEPDGCEMILYAAGELSQDRRQEIEDWMAASPRIRRSIQGLIEEGT